MSPKLLVLCAAMLGLTACEPISGSINFVKSITVKTQQQNGCGRGEMDACQTTYTAIPVGNASFDLLFRNEQSLTLTVKAGKKSIATDIMLPKGKTIPANGRVVFTSRELSQPFDLEANMRTDVSETPEEWGWEECTYTTREEVCRRDSKKGYICEIETVEHRGTRDVRFFYRTTDEYLEGRLTTPSNAADLIATMSGTRHDTDKIYTFQGQCMRH